MQAPGSTSEATTRCLVPGRLDGETVSNRPIASGASGRDAVLHYPEYRGEWNYPHGDLSIDQRHRARLWVNIAPITGLTLSVLQALESGVPYSGSNQNAAFVNGVDARLYIANPGYLTPPDGANNQYFFTERDAFRLEGQKRTDFAALYTRSAHGRRPQAGSVHPGAGDQSVQSVPVVRVRGQRRVCLGSNVQNQNIETAVRTNVTNPTLYQSFNPFTTTPVEGVHWAKSPAFGKALNRFAYTTPRTLRMTMGIRF